MEDDPEQKQQDTRDQNHCADPGPRGTFASGDHHGSSVVCFVQTQCVQPHGQSLLLRHGYHSHARHALMLREKPTPKLARQAVVAIFGHREGQHVAPVGGEAYKDRCVFGSVGDGDHGHDVRVVR